MQSCQTNNKVFTWGDKGDELERDKQRDVACKFRSIHDY